MKTIVLAVFLFMVSGMSYSQTGVPQQSISVTGYGSSKISADIIRLKVNVSDAYLTDGNTITTLMEKYTNLLKKVGVDTKKNVLKDTQIFEPPTTDKTPKRYETRFYSLELNSIDAYKKFTSEIYTIPGASFTLDEYTYSKMEQLKDETYQLAFNDAKNRAQKLLLLTGYKDAGILSIEDSSDNYVPANATLNSFNRTTTATTDNSLTIQFNAQLKIVYLFAR